MYIPICTYIYYIYIWIKIISGNCRSIGLASRNRTYDVPDASLHFNNLLAYSSLLNDQ